MSESRRSSNQVLAIIAILTLGLALVAALITASQDKKQYSANSPEGVVQNFLNSIIEGRNEDAARYFSSTSLCDATDIDRSWMPENVRVNLSSSKVEGNKAFIEVAIDVSSDKLFGDFYTEKHNFRLAQESGQWRILGIPWPLYSCEEVKQ